MQVFIDSLKNTANEKSGQLLSRLTKKKKEFYENPCKRKTETLNLIPTVEKP